MSPRDGENSYTDHSISAFDSSPREKEKMEGRDNKYVKMSQSIIKDKINGLLMFAELLATYVIWDMQTYLTDVWKLDFTHAAAIINVFTGATKIMPLGMLYFAETCIGHSSMLLSSSIAYCVGFGFLAMSTLSGTCGDYKAECIGQTQKVLYYTSLALIAVGKAGYMTSLSPFKSEQRRHRGDDSREYDAPRPLRVEECGYLCDDDGEYHGLEEMHDGLMICIIFVAGLVLPVSAIAILFIKSWPFRFGVPAISSAFVILALLRGTCSYGYAEPGETQGLEEQEGTIRSLVIWRVREVVEGPKIIICMIPLLMTFTVCGIVTSIGNTYFLEQAKHMNPNIGVLQVPLQIHRAFYDAANSLAECLQPIVELLSSFISLPSLGSGIAIFFSILCCITAAAVENGRLALIVKHNGIRKSMFWLLPQFMLLGSLEGFAQKSIESFFAYRVSLPMRRYKNFFAYGVIGAGEIGGALSVYIAGKASKMGGRPSWFQDTLNGSRLDKYYWALAALSSVNLVLYILVSIWYKHRKSTDDEDLLD